MELTDVNHLRRAFLWMPPCLHSCALGPLAGTETLGPTPNGCFSNWQTPGLQEQGSWNRIWKSPKSPGDHRHLTSWEEKKNQSHHNCVHFSGYLVFVAEIVGLFMPYLSSGQTSQLGHHPPLGTYLLGQACRINP